MATSPAASGCASGACAAAITSPTVAAESDGEHAARDQCGNFARIRTCRWCTFRVTRIEHRYISVAARTIFFERHFRHRKTSRISCSCDLHPTHCVHGLAVKFKVRSASNTPLPCQKMRRNKAGRNEAADPQKPPSELMGEQGFTGLKPAEHDVIYLTS
jgi:hypothetical protein